MEFEETASGLLLPKKSHPDLIVFVDEVKLHRKTGLLQAAVVLPSDEYHSTLAQNSKRQISAASRKEFHGTEMKTRTRPDYEAFIGPYWDCIEALRAARGTCSLVTVDPQASMQRHVEWAERIMKGVYGQIKATPPKATPNVALQLIWLMKHLRGVFPSDPEQRVHLVFDDTHSCAVEMTQSAFAAGQSGIVVGMTVERLVTLFVRNALAMLNKHNPTSFPQIEIAQVTFRRSDSEPGLQVADILANTAAALLRVEAGDTSKAATLRRDFFTSLVGVESLDPKQRSEFVLSDGQLAYAAGATKGISLGLPC